MGAFDLLDLGVVDDESTGDDVRAGGGKINKALLFLDSQRQQLAGMGVSQIIAGVGDSNTGHMHNPFLSSPYFQTAARIYNFDAYVPPYWACSAPGQRSGYVRDNMVPLLKAKILEKGVIPALVDVTSGQNDGLTQLDAAQNTFNNIVGTVEDILALGVPNVLLWGMLPDPKIIGRGRPEALEWLNTALMNWASTKPGVHFINALEIVKDRTGTAEALTNQAVWWRQGRQADGSIVKTHGEQPGLGAIGSTGIDNEHPAMYFGHLMAPRLGEILRRIFPVMAMPDCAPVDYAPAYNPLGNYLGKRGMFLGTGGNLNSVASPDIPANWNLTFDTSLLGSATITPKIVVDERGDRNVVLTGAGVPTGSGIIKLSTSMAYAAPAGRYQKSVRIRRRNMKGFSGYTIAGPGGGLGTATGLANILPEMVDDVLFPRDMELFNWSNSFSGQEFSLSTAFVAGVELSGSMEFARFSMVQRGNI